MKQFVIFCVILAAITGIAVSIIVPISITNRRNKERNAQVLSRSKKIASLLKLNKEINFHNISSTFLVDKKYDNKSNYNKIEPAYLMMAEIKNNINFFQGYFQKVKENREKQVFYKKQISAIQNEKFEIDMQGIEFSIEEFLQREENLFLNYILNPTIDSTIEIKMSYTSPKGQVNISKSGTFYFNEMFTCFESISRSHLDKQTYSYLSLVERGEVSDSLRYDILNRDNFKCVICGASSKEGARLHVDHIIPISKGGKSHPSNLRTLCERCNIGKSKKIEKPAEQRIEETSEEKQNRCLWCGSTLVLRKGKYGDFYGCSTYPKCKFTKKI